MTQREHNALALKYLDIFGKNPDLLDDIVLFAAMEGDPDTRRGRGDVVLHILRRMSAGRAVPRKGTAASADTIEDE